MKVLICVRRLDRGGAEMLECRLAKELNQLGIETHLACQYSPLMEGQKQAAAKWVDEGIPHIHWLKMEGLLGKLLAPIRLNLVIQRFGFQSIITSTHGTDIIGVLARINLKKVAHIVAFHDYPSQEQSKLLRVRIWKTSLQFVDKFYSITDYVRDSTKKHLNVPIENNTVVHNSVQHSVSFQVNEHKDIRNELNIPTNARILLFVGRIESRKGVDLLISILGSELEKWNAYLLLLGPMYTKSLQSGYTEYHAIINKQIADSRSPERILMLPFRNDVLDIMSSSDVLVHFARHEGFGLVLIEAIMAGIPIVASNVGGIPEALKDTPYTPVPLNQPLKFREEVEKWLFIDKNQRLQAVEHAKKVLPYFTDRRRAKDIVALLESTNPKQRRKRK